MSGALRILGVVACGTVAMLSAAPQALAAFGPPLQVSPALAHVPKPAVGVDATGASVVVWSEPGEIATIWARRVQPNGTLGPLVEVSNPALGAFDPAMAVGGDGEAFVEWHVLVNLGVEGNKNELLGRWVHADSSLGPVLTLAEPSPTEEPTETGVVVGPEGTATVGWENQTPAVSNRLELRRIGAAGSLGPQIDTTLEVDGLAMASLPSGATFAVTGAQTEFISAEGVASPPQNANDTGVASDLGSAVAFDAHGDGIIAWRRYNASSEFGMAARRISPSGDPTGPVIVLEPYGAYTPGAYLQAAADSAGDFLVGWPLQDEVNNGHARVARLDLAGNLVGPVRSVSPNGYGDPEPFLSIDDRGTSIAGYDYKASELSGSVVLGGLLDGLGALAGAPLTLSGASPGAGTAVAGNAPIGVTVVGFDGTIGSQQAVEVSRFLEPPLCSDSAASVVLGNPVRATLACTGVAIDGAKVVRPPLHGTLGAFEAATDSFTYTPALGYEGPDSFAVTAANEGGSSNTAVVSVNVQRARFTPPLIERLKLSRTRFRGARRTAVTSRRSRRPAVGTNISLVLDQPAAITLDFTQGLAGRRVHGRCVGPAGHPRARRCTRKVLRGALSFAGHAGVNHIVFYGRLASGRGLGPGSYTVSAEAVNAAGQRSARRSAAFSIVR